MQWPCVVTARRSILVSDCRMDRRAFLRLVSAAAAAGCASSRRSASRARRVPLVYDAQGGLFVSARVDGHGPVLLLLDTGASRSTVSTEFAGSIGLATSDGAPVEGSAGVVASRSARANVAIEGDAARELLLAVYAFGSYEPRCVGILGSDALAARPFRLRYRDAELVLDAPRPARTIAMELDNGIPRVEARVNGRAMRLRLDTGAAFPPGEDAYLNVTADEAVALGLVGKPVSVFTATGTGGAVLELPVHRLDALEVAGVALPRAFAIVQPRVGYFARADAVGFLGNSVLEKLDPWLDYGARRFGVEA